MTSPEPRLALADQPDSYYSPRQIERILRELPYLPSPGVYASDIRPMQVARGRGSDRLERQMCERADVEWALAELRGNVYRAVYLCHVGGKSLRDVAEIMGKSHESVRRWRTDGIREIAAKLGWSTNDVVR